MPFEIRRDEDFSKVGTYLHWQPQHAWSDNNAESANNFYFMSHNSPEGMAGRGIKFYKLNDNFYLRDGRDIRMFNLSTFLPVWNDGFLVGTLTGRIGFLDTNENDDLVSVASYGLGFPHRDSRIKRIFHTSGLRRFLAQNEDGYIDYFDLELAPDSSNIQVRKRHNAGWLYPDDPSALITDVFCWPEAVVINFHAILIKNKLILVHNHSGNKLDEFRLSAPGLAITYSPRHHNSIFCVLENGSIEIVSFSTENRMGQGSVIFDQDLSETIEYQHGRDVVAACFLKEEELIVLLEHPEGSNFLRTIVMDFDGTFMCEVEFQMAYNQTEVYDAKLIPAYDTNNFVVSFRQKTPDLDFSSFLCFARKFSIHNVDDRGAAPAAGGGAAPAAGGGAAPVRRGAKRPAPADDAPEFVKKAYLMEILSHLPKEEREALLQMTPDMQEKLKAESCSICLRDYNSKVTDKDEVTPVVAECGHIVCDDCAPQLPDGSCPECRVPFRKAEFELLLV